METGGVDDRTRQERGRGQNNQVIVGVDANGGGGGVVVGK